MTTTVLNQFLKQSWKFVFFLQQAVQHFHDHSATQSALLHLHCWAMTLNCAPLASRFLALLTENIFYHLSSSQLKRASSEDMLNKPGGTSTTSGVARLKKTSTSGAISELSESRLRSNPGREASSGKVLCKKGLDRKPGSSCAYQSILKHSEHFPHQICIEQILPLGLEPLSNETSCSKGGEFSWGQLT